MNSHLKAQIIVFTLGFFCNLTRHAMMESWSVSKPQIESSLSFDSLSLGALDMVFLFSYAAGNILSGLLSDRYNAKSVLCLGMVVSAIAQSIVSAT